MPKYMVEANLSDLGVAGVKEQGASRRHLVVKQAVESMGGKLDGYYFAFGDKDIVAIVDMPSNTAMVALATAFASGGAAAGLKTTVLLTPEEIDESLKLHADYEPPTDPRAGGR